MVQPCSIMSAAWGWKASCPKRVDAPYRVGPSRTWLKSKEPGERGGATEREESVTKFT